MKRTKSEKAITLVVLIITIIVLLILAVVAIRAVQGDGIISHAKNARDNYNEAQIEEQEKLSSYELILAQETGKAWKQNKTKVTKGNQTIEVGDYVNYVSGVEGYTDTNGWKVLGEENGQILLMSTENAGEFGLGGLQSYNEIEAGIREINAACSAYGNGTGAAGVRSIKVEDIDRITGYDKTAYDAGKVSGYGNKVTYTLEEDGDTLTYIVEGKPELNGSTRLSEELEVFKKPDGTELEAGETFIAEQNTYYSYEGSTYLETTSKAYKMLFRDNVDDYSDEDSWLGNTEYLVASPYYLSDCHTPDIGARIGLRYVCTGFVQGIPSTYSYIRAVVSLKSDIQLTETKTGSGVWNIVE